MKNRLKMKMLLMKIKRYFSFPWKYNWAEDGLSMRVYRGNYTILLDFFDDGEYCLIKFSGIKVRKDYEGKIMDEKLLFKRLKELL